MQPNPQIHINTTKYVTGFGKKVSYTRIQLRDITFYFVELTSQNLLSYNIINRVFLKIS